MVPFVNFTARIDGHPSDALSTKYEVRGFPTLMIIDASGNKAATPQGRDLESFSKAIDNLNDLDDLRERSAGGEIGLEAGILLAELNLGSIELKPAVKRRNGLALPKKLETSARSEWKATVLEIDALLFNLTVAEMFQNAGRDEDKQAELGKKLYRMAKDGQFATGDMTYGYWSKVMEMAKSKKDRKVFEKGYNALYAMYKDNPRAEQLLAEMKAELDAMK
ncbi:MAG: hypothetical protein ACI84O_000524 [Myxococcota bacterium]